MSSKVKVIVLLAGLTLVALAAFALGAHCSGDARRAIASAVWGA